MRSIINIALLLSCVIHGGMKGQADSSKSSIEAIEKLIQSGFKCVVCKNKSGNYKELGALAKRVRDLLKDKVKFEAELKKVNPDFHIIETEEELLKFINSHEEGVIVLDKLGTEECVILFKSEGKIYFGQLEGEAVKPMPLSPGNVLSAIEATGLILRKYEQKEYVKVINELYKRNFRAVSLGLEFYINRGRNLRNISIGEFVDPKPFKDEATLKDEYPAPEYLTEKQFIDFPDEATLTAEYKAYLSRFLSEEKASLMRSDPNRKIIEDNHIFGPIIFGQLGTDNIILVYKSRNEMCFAELQDETEYTKKRGVREYIKFTTPLSLGNIEDAVEAAKTIQKEWDKLR